MANMSYCRFSNTVNDLRDCLDNIDAQLSEREHFARLDLFRLCNRILENAGQGATPEEMKEILAEVDSWQ